MTEWDGNAGQWTEEAIRAYGMVAGDQWSDEDKAQMEEDGRPSFTFNRIAGFLRGVSGLEASNRQEVRYIARDTQDTPANEIYNAAAKWARDLCDAEDEESDSFKDMLTCGLGWTETRFSTEDDPDGQIVIERIDPLHMRYDLSSRKRGLVDSQWRARIKYVPISEIRERWGKKKAEEIQAYAETDSDVLNELFSTPHDATKALEYEKNANGSQTKKGVPTIQFQYFEFARYYRVQLEGQVEDLPEDRFKKLKELFPDLLGQAFRKKVFKQLIYAGDTELEHADLLTDDFTLQAITGVRDRNKGTWYGFARDMLDPQGWINKFFSSMADVVASQAKGGLLAEADAFVNKDQAQDEWSNPRSIVWLKRGGLEKIKERSSAGIPNGVAQLLEFTVGSLPHVAGVNLEFLGLVDRNQPGVLETQRKKAAIATLQEFFNSMRLYRKQQGRVLLQFIDNYLTDGRLVRIVGPEQEQFVPLIRQPGMRKYDVVVDEAPTAPDVKARTWDAVVQIAPIAMNMGIPIPPDVLDYAPFPTSLTQKWKQMIAGQGAVPPQVQAQMQQMQAQMQALQQENLRLKSKQEEAMAQLQVDQQRAQQELQLAAQKAAAEEQRKIREVSVKEFVAERELAIKEAIAAREIALKEQQWGAAEGKLVMDRIQQTMELAQQTVQQDREIFQARSGAMEDMIKPIQEAVQQQSEMIKALQSDMGDSESEVMLDYTPDGDIKGAVVKKRRKQRSK